MAPCGTEGVVLKFGRGSADVLFLAWYSKQEVPEVLGSQFPQIQPNFGKFRRLGSTPSSYMTLITWKREDGKKFGSRVFEGFLIADK